MNDLPGSRQQLRRSRVALLSGAIVAAAVVVFAHDVLAGSESLRDIALFRKRWVGLPGAIPILLGAVSLHMARQQWASGLYPMLTYMRRQRTESEFALDVPAGDKLWCIEVRNMGGLAVVDRVTYDVEIEGEPATRKDGLTYQEMLGIVESSTGFLDEVDFVYVNWQGGFGIFPGEVERLCELPMPVARRLKRLDAHVYYKSRFGGLYKHLISVVPDRGLPPDVRPRGEAA